MGAGLEGTNREWLHKQNDYDLLCRMQDNLTDGQEIFCVLYLLTGDKYICINRWINCDCDACKSCIADWLNEKHS